MILDCKIKRDTKKDMSYLNLPKLRRVYQTYPTKTELVFIEEYHEIGLSGRKIADKLKCSHESIYRVIRQLT